MIRRALAILALAAIVALTGCPSVAQRVAIKSCQFSLHGVEVVRITPLEVELAVTLGIYNPNDIDVIVDRFDYTALIDGRKLADGQSRDQVTIPVNHTRDLRVSVRAATTDAAAAVQRLLPGGEHTITFRGTSYIEVPWGVHEFPVEVSRQFRADVPRRLPF